MRDCIAATCRSLRPTAERQTSRCAVPVCPCAPSSPSVCVSVCVCACVGISASPMRVKELVCEHVDVLVSANVRAYACACARAGICKCASVDTRAHTKVLRRKRGHSQLRLGVFAPHAERERVRRRASHGKRERLGRRTGKLKKAQESDGTSRKCKGLLTSRTPSDSKKSLAVHENSRKLMKVLGTSRTLM
eukprot:6199220-Pleurochrysis_carterae.AAC.2